MERASEHDPKKACLALDAGMLKEARGQETKMFRSHAVHSSRPPACDAAAARKFFDLGITCSTGAGTPDLVSAHKWFNLAAMHGSKQASALRLEIAAELSESEIAAAQRAARDWLANQ
jgi:TPR repeat protein